MAKWVGLGSATLTAGNPRYDRAQSERSKDIVSVVVWGCPQSLTGRTSPPHRLRLDKLAKEYRPMHLGRIVIAATFAPIRPDATVY